jgi:dsRNA-specific ribonuclease
MQLKVNGVPETQGTGKSKKQAEQQAAEAMLEKEN